MKSIFPFWNIHVAMANHKKHNYLHFTSSSSSLTKYSPYLSPFESTTSPQLACHSVLLPMPTSKVTARVQISKWLQGSLKQAHTYTYPVAASIQAEWSLQCMPWQLEFRQNDNYNAQNYLQKAAHHNAQRVLERNLKNNV